MKQLREIFLTSILFVCSLVPCGTFASVVNDSEALETASIQIQGLSICHQNEWRNLNVNLEYLLGRDRPVADIQNVKSHIRSFLDQYSSMDEFWEIMNTKLVRSVAEAFPEMDSIKSTLSLAPDATLKSHRRSIVSLVMGEETLKEVFGYTRSNYLICQETFKALDLHITWKLVENPNPETDYPDYQWIDEAVDRYFQEHPVSFSEWKTLKPMLVADLMEKFPSIDSADINVVIVE